jgi:hypothetical protein
VKGAPATEPDGPPKRAIAFGAATVVTAVLVALALYLGHWAYQTRSGTIHHGRLQRMLEQKPTPDQVVAGLEAEGMRTEGIAGGDGVKELADRWGGRHRDAILAQAARAAVVYVFAGDGYVYFVFFDQGKMVDFTFVSS